MERLVYRDIAFEYLRDEASILWLVMDDTGRIVEANRHAVEILGDGVRELCFDDIFVDFSGNLTPRELSLEPDKTHMLNVNLPSSTPLTLYFRFLRVDGLIAALGQRDAAEDATLRREVLSLNSELNNTTRELHKTNAELEKLNALKNQFLGMAAHDLRKPTGLAMTYSELLLEDLGDQLDDKHHRFLSTIHSSSHFMARMIDDFLDVSMIESGHFELDIQPTELAFVIENACTLVAMQARKKDISIEVFREPNPIHAGMDGPKIEQSLSNLLANAIDHSPSGSTVSVRCELNADRLSITVQDEGEGIAPHEIDKLFEPFKTDGARKTGQQRSIGLGLAITRKIVKEHGGEIEVVSQLGKGSSFRLLLPVNPPEGEIVG